MAAREHDELCENEAAEGMSIATITYCKYLFFSPFLFCLPRHLTRLRNEYETRHDRAICGVFDWSADFRVIYSVQGYKSV